MSLRDRIIDEAQKYLGIYYQWGGNYPETAGHYGLDCSHFTYRVLKTFGLMNNYKTAAMQKNWCTPISKEELKKGDLVFYTWGTNSVKHVEMYMGNEQLIGCSGGDSTVTTQKRASSKKAMVKVKRFSSMKPSYFGRPIGLE